MKEKNSITGDAGIMKRIIGVTGGVGCGKSPVLNTLREEYGAEVIEADAVARALMEPGQSAYEAVVRTFGVEILSEELWTTASARVPFTSAADSRAALPPIDRAKLAAIVFADPGKRELLNSLTHPAVEQEVRRRMQESAAEIIVYESAIPAEAKMRALCGEIWYVYAPQEVRIRRLMASRGYSREKCLSVMASQLSEEAFRELSDHVIDNGGTTEETAAQIRKLLG